MLSKFKILILLAIYFAMRVFSFYFVPGRSFTNSIVNLIILGFTSYLIATKKPAGWYLIMAELLLGGNGNFLSFGPISLRTLLLITSFAIYLVTILKDHGLKALFYNNQRFFLICGALFLALGIAGLVGLHSGHSFKLIFSELIPYAFLLYYFPFKKLGDIEPYKTRLLELFTAAVFGTCIFSFVTFLIYSSGMGHLQDAYYHWFRDIANGKITDLNFNFYRVVLNEQLLLVPALLFAAYNLINKKLVKFYAVISLLLLFTLSYNLTRIYFLALAGGLLLLINKEHLKFSLKVIGSYLIIFLLLFTSLHFISSQGQSFGLELFGLRLQSIVAPDLDQSSLSRLLLLPKIIDKIKLHPIIGNGLGSTLTVFSPVLNQTITTAQFDWGWLQIYTELGLFGVASWLMLLYFLYKKISVVSWSKLGYAVVTALVISTITSPIIFHVLGFTLLTAMLAITPETPRLSRVS